MTSPLSLATRTKLCPSSIDVHDVIDELCAAADDALLRPPNRCDRLLHQRDFLHGHTTHGPVLGARGIEK